MSVFVTFAVGGYLGCALGNIVFAETKVAAVLWTAHAAMAIIALVVRLREAQRLRTLGR